MTDLPIETLIACIVATLLYIPTFMVAYDRFETWTTSNVHTVDAAAPKVRTLKGLAAEPTALPRTVLGSGRAPSTPVHDDFVPTLVARLDAVPSIVRTATA